MNIAENVAAVREVMDRAAREAGRDPKEILLLAATKMNDADRVREAIRAGVDLCGENRVQEMLEKQKQGAYDGVPLHFIGHLQKNKVKQVVGNVCAFSGGRLCRAHIHSLVNSVAVCAYDFATAFKRRKAAPAEQCPGKRSLSACGWRKYNDDRYHCTAGTQRA